MKMPEAITALHEDMTEWRHGLHAWPELAFAEVRTAAFVAGKLRAFGLEVATGIGGTGVVGTLRHGEGGSVGLRADMDALPMDEAGRPPYRSQNPGVFHGCGHDGHTTMLLGAARHLAATRRFSGTVHFIFQPAEEGEGGARAMIADGLFERFPCDVVYGLHNWPALPPGEVAVRAGPLMAAADMFDVTISGRGGHAAMPEQTVDPVVVAAQVISALQTIVSRGRAPTDSVVISVCTLRAGSAYNVIPDRVTMSGTVRTLTTEARAAVEGEMRRVVEGVARSLGAEASLTWIPGYPATINHPGPAETVARVARGLLGADHVHTDLPPTMGAEDFSFMLQERPGAYFWLGNGGGPLNCGLHNPHYDFNDAVLPIGVALFTALVEDAL